MVSNCHYSLVPRQICRKQSNDVSPVDILWVCCQTSCWHCGFPYLPCSFAQHGVDEGHYGCLQADLIAVASCRSLQVRQEPLKQIMSNWTTAPRLRMDPATPRWPLWGGNVSICLTLGCKKVQSIFGCAAKTITSGTLGPDTAMTSQHARNTTTTEDSRAQEKNQPPHPPRPTWWQSWLTLTFGFLRHVSTRHRRRHWSQFMKGKREG